MAEKITNNLKDLIRMGETYTIEFKEAKNDLPKSLFESICGLSNRNGGHIFLGIKDDGTVLGVDEDSIVKMKRDFSNQCNNPQKINPTIYATLNEYEINGKIILYAYIPESSNVHRSSGKYFDRNEDGDYELKNSSLIESLYLRKQSNFSENRKYNFICYSAS